MKKNIKNEWHFVLLKIAIIVLFVIVLSLFKFVPNNSTMSFRYFTNFFVSFGPIMAFVSVLVACILINNSQGINKLRAFDLFISVIAYIFVMISGLILTLVV